MQKLHQGASSLSCCLISKSSYHSHHQRLQHHRSNLELPEAIINLLDRCSGRIMDARARKIPANPVVDKKLEYNRSFSQGSHRRLLPASYFGLESLLLLICLTASLLILPLILPPLPPPPFMLLLIPIGILAVLMILAFMPSNARDITYTYM